MAGFESPRPVDPYGFLGVTDISGTDSGPGRARPSRQRFGWLLRGWSRSRQRTEETRRELREDSVAASTGGMDGAGAASGAGQEGGGDVKSQHSRHQASLDGLTPDLQTQVSRSCDPTFQHGVVVGFDGSLSSERALAYAVGMARRSRCGLVIVHVANRLPATVWAGCEPPVFVDAPDHRTEVLGLELACADFLTGVPWILVERGGDICHEIEEVGKEYAADAIVVGTTHGLLVRLFGSVSGRLARRANRPVIVIP
jgi:nucleotide-binding universal stress UspA family protein